MRFEHTFRPVTAASLIPPDAEDLVNQALFTLVDHLGHQLRDLAAKDRDLQPGILGRHVLARIKKAKTKPLDVWLALYASLFAASEVTPYVYSSTSTDLYLLPAVFCLMERDNVQGAFELNISFQHWKSLLEGKSRETQIQEIKRLCDWIEAFIAVDAYGLYKLNRNCFDSDAFSSFVNILGTRIKNLPDHAQTEAFRKGMDSIRTVTQTSTSDLTAAKMHKDDAAAWKTPRLDRWLFRVWPLVKHYDWNLKELHGVIIERMSTVLEVNDKEYPCKSPETLGTHCRSQLGLKHKDRPLGRPLRSGKTEDIPRVQLVRYLWDQ